MGKGFKYGMTIALMTCLAVMTAGSALAAEFSADVVQKLMGQVINGKMWVKNDRSRMDMTMKGQDTTIITDPAAKKIYMLQHAAKMVMVMPYNDTMTASSGEWDEEALARKADIKKLGTETINGYKCEKKEVIYKDKQVGKMTVWVAEKFKLPIKTVVQSQSGPIETEYKNIKTGGVSDSVFAIPAGYQKMDMPAGMSPPKQ